MAIRIGDLGNICRLASGIYYTEKVPKRPLVDSLGFVLKDSNGLILLGSESIHPERVITAIYYNKKVLWESARSCFSNNIWRNDKPWFNNEPWK